MKKILHRIWERIRFDQKKKWDKKALAFFDKCSLIIDLGSGDGRFAAQEPARIIGLEKNKNSLQISKSLGLRVVKGDIRELPFRDESIQGIHCAHVLEHLFPDEAYRLLKEINRVLSPGSVFVIRTPLLWSDFYSDLTHVRPYNPDAIIGYMTTEKQRVFSLDPISKKFKVVRLKWRYAPIPSQLLILRAFFNIINRWGFPWLKRNGYMLVLKK